MIKKMKMYHKPVLLEESIIGLKINPNGIYVDATFGGGGHSKEILNNLNSKGRLIAFDQDQDAIENRLLDKRLNLVKSNFKYLNNYLNYFQINKIDGLLADFGISSHQIDNEIRGFSTRFDSELDMRMNNSQKTDAKEVVNNFKTDQLEYIFKNFGELKNYRKITQTIISQRIIKEIKTIIKNNCSPRHVPSKIIKVKDIPYTLSGKKVELAVKNIVQGIKVVNKDSLENPSVLNYYKNIAELKT